MILRTDETKTFSTEDGVKTFLRQLEDTERWTRVAKRDVFAGEVIDCPILMDEAMKKVPVPVVGTANANNGIVFPRLEEGKSFSLNPKLEEGTREAMATTRIALGVIENGDLKANPLAINALDGLVGQAGFQRASVLVNLDDRRSAHAMRAEIRTAIINEGLSLMNGDCLLYSCDEMMRGVHSDGYVPLKITELVEALETGLKNDFPDTKLVGASVSHQFTAFDYELNDQKLQAEIENVLRNAGVAYDFVPVIRFCTSNTGDSGANLYAGVKHGSTISFIEEPIRLEHTGSASIEKFSDNVGQILALFKSTPEKLEKLGEVKIKNTAQCYKNIALAAGIPVKAFAEKAEDFEAVYGDTATALDVYFDISEALEEYAKTVKMQEMRKVQLSALLARVALNPEHISELDVNVQTAKY